MAKLTETQIEKVVKVEGFDFVALKAACKGLNDCGALGDDKIAFVAKKKEAIVKGFIVSFESVDEGTEQEKLIPPDVVKLYNSYVDVIEDSKMDLTEGDPAGEAEADGEAREEAEGKKLSNIDLMKSLLKEKKTDEEIEAVFIARYAEKGNTNADFAKKRVKTYKSIAAAG